MAKTEELFELIQSMSKGEKRYFKVYTSKLKKKDITYIKIFDLIVTQPSYDKESFIKKIKNPKILKQLHVINNYLYHKILDSLEAYHQDRFVHLAIIKMLNQSFVLIKRGLYHQAATFLSRAKKQIIATEKYELIPELLRQERTINTRKILPQKPEEILTPLREDAKTILQKLDDFNTFADLNLLFFIALSNLLAKKSGAEADLKKLMDHPFLDKKKTS